MYIQPIPPVLDVTRQLVIPYNAMYKQAVAGIKGIHYLHCKHSTVSYTITLRHTSFIFLRMLIKV